MTADIWEKDVLILAGNMNLGLSYSITTVKEFFGTEGQAFHYANWIAFHFRATNWKPIQWGHKGFTWKLENSC